VIPVDAREGLALGLDELSGMMFQRSADAMLFTAPDGRVLAANAAACEMLQLPEREICRRGRAGLADPADPRWIAAVSVRQVTGRFFGELSTVRGNGETFPAEVSSALFVGPDGSERSVVVMRDMTERKNAERRLRDLGHVDELTGALNRRGFCAEVPERLREAASAGLGSALLFVDVDRLKELNDSWGYATGDAALREVVELLRSSARDGNVIARWGGDEFVVLTQLQADDTPESVAGRAKNRFHIRNAQAPPYPLHVSIGVEPLHQGAGIEVDAAVMAAQAAMARHREHGRGRRRRPTR
jgi:diguanylate cyclase (GGDEF)-like protein/PAS domain S-box-containing protein